MKTYLPSTKFPDDASEGFAGQLLRAIPAEWRSWVWPGTLVAMVVFGMLAAFHQVVQGAVHQGDQRRKASAVLVEANWRCNTANNQRARDDCLFQISAAAYAEAGLRAPDSARHK